jgi:hypothetical protein
VVGIAVGLAGAVGPTSVAASTQSAAHADPAPLSQTAAQAPFRVASPPVLFIGGVYTPRRTCKSAEVHADARLRESPDGVVGVVTLTTKHKCDIHVGDLTPTLYDAQHHSLGVPVVADPDTTNPAVNEGWGPFTTLGFAWDGSWCGASAATVEVPLTKGTVQASLSGPQPGCAGSSTAMVIPGAFGYPGDPVQGAPPEWRFLTASFHVPAVTRSPALVHPFVTFTNSSDQPVVLGPTPTYQIGVHDKYGDGTYGGGERALPLPAGPTVPADGSLLVDLPTQSLVDDYRNLRGKRLTPTFAIAGAPTASTTSELDHAALNSYKGHCRLDGSTLPTYTIHGNKECVSLKWKFASQPKPVSRVLHLTWRGYCVRKHVAVDKRETRHSVVLVVTDIEQMTQTKGHCGEVRGHVAVRLASRLGSRTVDHAPTQP